MEINLWAVVTSGILAMVIGYVWYGPLFGKKWMSVNGSTALDLEERRKMQKGARNLYFIQFAMVLLQAYVVSYAPMGWFPIWLAFIVPTIASTVIWNNDSSKVKWTKFLIQAGYQFVIFFMFGLILGLWR